MARRAGIQRRLKIVAKGGRKRVLIAGARADRLDGG